MSELLNPGPLDDVYICRDALNSLGHKIQLLTTLKKRALENTVGKGGNADRHGAISLFHTVFCILPKREIVIFFATLHSVICKCFQLVVVW